jgi:tripartite-type tricarboxylate transporter receptor subunit TctC
MHMKFRLLPYLAVLCVALFAPLNASAAEFPTKPIKWVLGYGAGGASDTIARTISQKMPDILGQPVVIENRRGASGIIAANFAAKSAPDGYTLLLVSSGFLTNIAMGRKMAFDFFKDFEAVTTLGTVPNIVVVNPESNIHSIKDLIAAAKAEPGKINYGTGGIGTGTHIATELFDIMTGVKMVHIPFKGTPPALTALMGGRIQVMFAGAPPSLPLVRSGKLRAIAVTSPKKTPVAPQYPPVADTVPGFDGVTYYAVVVPAGTPKPIVAKLNAAFTKALNDESVKATLLKRGFVAESSTVGEATKELQVRVADFKKAVKEAGIKPVK